MSLQQLTNRQQLIRLRFEICAKLELAFSRMNRTKTDRRSSLSRDRLDVLLRISEDGPFLEKFNPDASIDC